MLYFPQIFNVDSNSMIGTQNSLFQWYHCCCEYTERSQEAPLTRELLFEFDPLYACHVSFLVSEQEFEPKTFPF